jgi:hypothetical protein
VTYGGREPRDKLTGVITPDLWQRKSTAWQEELIEIRQQLNAFGNATADYYRLGTEILELANSAYGLYLKQEWDEKAKLLRSLLSNSTFVRGTLYPTYNKPFDILAKGSEFLSKRPQYHSPQTLVEFNCEVKAGYSTASGSRWKVITEMQPKISPDVTFDMKTDHQGEQR